jgi:hypothetical protein
MCSHKLERIRDYIRANPAKWDGDPENLQLEVRRV